MQWSNSTDILLVFFSHTELYDLEYVLLKLNYGLGVGRVC